MLNVEILCNPRIPVVKTSNVGFPNISYWWILEGLPSKYNPKPIHLLGSSPHLHGGFKDFLFKTPTCGLKPPTCHVLIKQKHLGWNWLESGFFHTLIFSETRHGAYLHPGLWTRYGVSMIKTQNQEVLTSNKFHTDSKGFNVFFSHCFFFHVDSNDFWWLLSWLYSWEECGMFSVFAGARYEARVGIQCGLNLQTTPTLRWNEQQPRSSLGPLGKAVKQTFSLLSATGSHDIEEIFGTQNWLVMATQCGFAFMLESLGKKSWNITNQRTKGKTYWWHTSPMLSLHTFDAHLMLWCGMTSVRLVEWPTWP